LIVDNYKIKIMSYPTQPAAPVIEKQNPFYITNNSSYGTNWQSAGNQSFGALKADDSPLWRQTVSIRNLTFRVSKILLLKTPRRPLNTKFLGR